MANIRVKDLPNTNAANDNDEFIVDSSTSGTRRISYSELKSEISTDFAADVATYGIATLDSDNKLTASQIPDSLAQGMNFVGVANSASDLTSTTQGDFYVIQTAFGIYSVGDQAVYDGSAYVRVVDGTKEISEGGTGATTLDAAKTNLEIIDVGTGPSQVPLNQHLGTMAYQDIAGVSVAELEVESTTGTATTQALTVTDGTNTNFVVQEDGKVGIGGNPSTTNPLRVSSSDATTPQALIQSNTSTGDAALSFNVSGRTFSLGIDKSDSEKFKISRSSELGNTDYVTIDGGNVGINQGYPSSFNGDADDLVVGDGSGSRGVSIVAGAGSNSTIFFADGAAGAAAYQGRVQYNHLANELRFGTGSLIRWKVDSSGNLVSYNGLYGIDFGSGSTLDEYELGSHTTTVGVSGSGSVTMGSSFDRIGYGIIGDCVSITGLLKVGSVSSPTGILTITLPTVPANFTESGAAGGGAVAYYDASANSWSNVPFTFEEGSSEVAIRIDASTLAASDQIRLSFVYFQV